MMPSDAFVVRLLVNAAWQVPLCGLSAMVLDVMLRRWPAYWRVALWRSALLAAALVPLVVAWWNPAPRVTAGFVLPAVDAAIGGASDTQGWNWPVAWMYASVVGFLALRLAWRWWLLRNLNTETAVVPLTFGVRRAVVVIPKRFAQQATPLAREAASAHESVHVQQRDYLHLLIAECMTLPVAMHPGIGWMKARLRRAVELRCDELAAATFADPRDYAQGLLDAARLLAGAGSGPALAPGFWSSNTFEERMNNLMQAKQMPGRIARLAAAGTMLAVGIGVITVSTRYAIAQQKQQDGTVYKVGQDGVSAPKVLHKVEPQYSEAAKDAKVSGTVTLRLEITPQGKAEKFQVVKSLEPSLDQAAIDAVKQWQFQAAQKNGSPVRVSATIEVQFRLL